MRIRGLAATALGFVLVGCGGGYQQPSAVLQQHTYANCTGNSGQCRPRQLAAASAVSRVRTNAVSKVDAQPAKSASNSIPTVDVEQICRSIAEQGMRAKEDCVNTEREVRNELIKKWGGFDTADQARCASVSTAGGVSSYTELLICLQMASSARKLREETNASRDSLAIGQR